MGYIDHVTLNNGARQEIVSKPISDSIATEYSDSQTYAVGDYCMYEGTLYKCKTAIDTAEIWTPSHWVVDKITNEVSGLKSAMLDYNVVNLCDYLNHYNADYNGITYTWHDDGSCTVYGTATAITYNNMFISTNSLPSVIKAGSIYGLFNASSNVHFIIYNYSNGNITLLAEVYNNYPSSVKIPANCTGLIIRLWIANGTSVNETVKPIITADCKSWDNVLINKGSASYFATDANNIVNDSVCFVSLSSGSTNVANVPISGWLETVVLNNNISLQRVYPYETDKFPFMMRTKQSGTWGTWVAVNTNGYIQAVDTDTADETGKTDMTDTILYALSTHGHCKLSEGTFYVRGGIRMPEGSTLEGSGEGTKIRLLSGNNKYAVMLTKYCTIQNLVITGSYTDLTQDDFSSSAGSRYGIQYYKGSSDTWNTAYCSITNVHIRNFTGAGIYQYGTGANVEQGLFVSNVHIKNCWAGIWIYANSEFCRYSNVQMTYCYIACINNGGNNAFDNCVFHAYSIGMKIDGTQNNAAHGMCSNSSFCHTGDNAGSALTLSSIAHGYVFSSNQFWYNSIDISSCGGIVFNGCEFGRSTSSGSVINITGGDTVAFVGCMFMNDVSYPPSITISNNSKVKFANCYGSVSGNDISA